MNFSLHPSAANDLAAIVAFYQQQANAAVAAQFIDEFERVVRLLMLHPGLGTPFDLPRRTYPLRIFPYSVIYKPLNHDLRVLAVRHHRRHPQHAQKRH